MLRRISCFLFTGLVVLFLVGCGAQNLPTKFSLSGPNQVSKPGLPFMTYTVVTHADGNREFVYFMIIKPPKPANGFSQQATSSESSAVGLNGHAKSKISINGKELTVEYKMKVRGDGTLDTESFVVGGQNQTFDKGRVFLVDLSTEPVRIVTHVAKLSSPNADLRNPTATENQAKTTLKELEEDSQIAEFTRPLH